MATYYELLGVDNACSLEEIKKAFRKRAKELHPDTTAAPGPSTIETMRLLIKAYRVLSDPEQRERYDRSIRLPLRDAAAGRFDYRGFLRGRGTPESLSTLVFFDLLHEYEDEAIDLYERILRRRDYSIEDHLDREDFMDCAFLLAEEYQKRGDAVKAAQLLVTLVAYEQEEPYFRHFMDEVLVRLRALLQIRPSNSGQAAELLALVERVLDCGLTPRDEATYCRTAAELSLYLDDDGRALDYVERALKIDNRMPMGRRIRERIGSFVRL